VLKVPCDVGEWLQPAGAVALTAGMTPNSLETVWRVCQVWKVKGGGRGVRVKEGG